MKKKISITDYVEYYFSKYKELSSFDLEVLINSLLKSELTYVKIPKDLRSTVTVILHKLKKECKIIKDNENKKWVWFENDKM